MGAERGPRPLRVIADEFSAVADTDPAQALQLWGELAAHPDRPRMPLSDRLAALDDLAAVWSATGEHARAVATAEEALAATPTDDPDLPYRQSCLADRVEAGWLAEPSDAGFARLLAARRAAVDGTAPADPVLVTRLSALADAYRTRWWAATDTGALDTAVLTLREAEAVARSIGVDPARPAGNLAVVLADRFAAAGDDADLGAALEAAARAGDGSPAGHPDRGTHMLLHATLLSDRYDRHGLLADLHDALAVAYATLDEDLDDDRELARLQNLLGVLELDRFQIEDDAAHLTVAVDWARAATATADPADPALAGYLTNSAPRTVSRSSRR